MIASCAQWRALRGGRRHEQGAGATRSGEATGRDCRRSPTVPIDNPRRRFGGDSMSMHISRRNLLKAGGALVISFALPLPAFAQRADAYSGKSVDVGEVDGFFAVNQDGSVTLFCGKVDLGTGLRIAIPQMAAEELGIAVKRITLIEGDTDLTPDQGSTAGSSGVMRGGVQIRQAAATAREALIRMAAERMGRAPAELVAADGEVRPRSGAAGIGFGALVGNRHFGLKLDPKAPLKDPASY